MQIVGAVVIGYILAQFLDFQFFTESAPSEESDDDSSQNPVAPNPDDYEVPGNTQESVWSNEDGLVHVWRIGIHMGGIEGQYEYHYRIGNASGTSFTSTSTPGGGKPAILQYATEQEAIDVVLESEEPSSPGGPEVAPEPEEPTEPPVMPPLRPPTGFGPSQGSMTTTSAIQALPGGSMTSYGQRTKRLGVL
tara:strand:+ start:9010 stop:9585 length:576 start_codon:yes stop_codon:yes gene_type:complete